MNAVLPDGDRDQARAEIRRCVHCGFCTATCPTYVLLGGRARQPPRPHRADESHAGQRPAPRPRRPLPTLTDAFHACPASRRAPRASTTAS
ncbi:4Fe-4S dicluster domain-containing protein [Phenylobacterium sp. J426]|uniref:4Fe-4S dicluster domain-containing protein n=1 Tax=Phenylobacterium sp. J426 TaxID=2898439 RepID=UPI0035B10C3E